MDTLFVSRISVAAHRRRQASAIAVCYRIHLAGTDNMLKILGRDTFSNVMKVLWACSELDIEFDRKGVAVSTAGTIPRISTSST